MKAFDTPYHQAYYKDWIYLGTINGEDYYFQGLPSAENKFPSTSIVYGKERHEYVSTTMSVSNMLHTDTCSAQVSCYLLHNYTSMIHLIMLVRAYAAKQKQRQ